MIKISAVSYINTYPFVYGINQSKVFDNYSLSLDYPSECVKNFILGEADISLIPVGALSEINDFKIISNHCIGSNKNVKTVLLLSQVPIEDITTIYLDHHSVTSAKLIRLLAEKHWKKEFKWKQINLSEDNKHESVLAIGDKVFDLQHQFRYHYDLAYEWHQFTGMPFVFACWVAKKHIDDHTIQEFNQALSFGINNKEKAIKEMYSGKNQNQMIDYVNENIDYQFSDKMKKSLTIFLDLIHSF